MHAVKVDLINCGVGCFERFGERLAARGDAQDTPARRGKAPFTEQGARVEDFRTG